MAAKLIHGPQFTMGSDASKFSSFYDKETKLFTYPDQQIDFDSRGLGWVLFECMKSNLDKVAQIDAESGIQDLYSSFLKRCVKTALKMKSLGITSNDIISICSYNHLNNTVPLLAALFLGVKVASLDPSLSMEDTIYLMNLVKPKLVFTSTGSEALIDGAIKALSLDAKIVVFGDTDGFMKFEEFVECEGNDEDFEPSQIKSIEDTALILFSSGTTGMPKGICLNHRLFLGQIGSMPIKVCLSFSSLYWVSGNMFTFNTIKMGGAKIVFKKFDPQLTWTYIEKYKVTYLFVAPCDAITLCQNMSDIEVSEVQEVLLGGSYVPPDCVDAMRRKFPNAKVKVAYGQTELMIVLDSSEPVAYNKPNCVGMPIPGRTYKVVDPDTEETLGINQPGELRIKTNWCMNGYYNVDSRDSWDSEGFVKTGDIMYYDEDFCFFFVDRLKEMFKYKSWHIVPAKLETLLMNHPEVLLGIVVGIPHREDDNHAIAVIVPVDGATITPEEIQKYVDEKVDDRHKLRGGVRFAKSLPMTPSGKIRRRAIVQMVVNNEI